MEANYGYYRKLVTSEYRFSVNFHEWLKALIKYVFDYASEDIGAKFKTINFDTNSIGVTLGGIDYETVGADFVVNDLSLNPASLTDSFNYIFDVDTAKETQLDVLGQVVGVSRITQFQPSEDSAIMDDETYRLCIKAKIIKNTWKGNAADLFDAWRTLFPDTLIFEIQDLQDMSFNVVVSGNFTTLQRELITNGYILPKPEGVRINQLLIVDMTGLPLFAYDSNTLYQAGYGSHWAVSVGG